MKRKFYAEIKKVEARKMASLDIEVRLTVATDNATVMDLGKLSGDQLVMVSVETVDDEL